MTKRIYTLFIVLCAVLQSMAQQGRMLTTDRELSSSLVNQVFQDRDGLIWMATSNGLVLYDGYRSQTFYKATNEKDSRGMISNQVRCMAQAPDGRLVLGFFNGVQTFDHNRFETVAMYDLANQNRQCYVNHILVRRNGDVLIATSGVGIMQLDKDGKARQVGGALGRIAFPRHIMETSDGTLWVATEDQGVVALKGHSVTHYLNAPGQNTLATSVCQDLQGNIYVANANDGLSVLRRGARLFEKIAVTAGSPVVSMMLSRDGSLLVGTNGHGLYRYQPSLGTYQPTSFFSIETDLSQGKVYSITEDR